jgi:D-alanine-D-alanine ligase-like ATP-grasp enzyme
MNADMVISAQGRTYLVYDAGQHGVIGTVWCDSGCNNPAAWRRQILETNEQLIREFKPASPLSCGQQDGAWLDALPSAAVTPTGQLVVAYDTKYVARCFYYDPADPTRKIYTKVERVWWAVRWARFS